MSPIPDDVDPDALIRHLSGSLSPPQRESFCRAAKAALELVPCLGPGSAYRAVAALQCSYWDPPPERQAGARHHRPSKLARAAPIGASDPREGARDRRRLKVVG